MGPMMILRLIVELLDYGHDPNMGNPKTSGALFWGPYNKVPTI